MSTEIVKSLQDYVEHNIPISRALGARVLDVSKKSLTVAAPLQENINHKRTVFGGSLQAVATLACWSLLHHQLRGATDPGEIVITNSAIDYVTPVTSDFTATAYLPGEDRWQHFMKMFDRRGKARLQLQALIYQGDDLAVDYTGTFAAIKS